MSPPIDWNQLEAEVDRWCEEMLQLSPGCLQIVKAAFESWSYGDPTDPRNLQGPQVSRRQQQRVLEDIEKLFQRYA